MGPITSQLRGFPATMRVENYLLSFGADVCRNGNKKKIITCFLTNKVEFSSNDPYHLHNVTSIRYNALTSSTGACGCLFRVRVCRLESIITNLTNLWNGNYIEILSSYLPIPSINQPTHRYFVLISLERTEPVRPPSHFATPCTACWEIR